MAGNLGPNQRVTALKAVPTSSNLSLHHVSGGTYPSWIPQCLWRCCTWPREIKISKPGENSFLHFLYHVPQWLFAAFPTANSDCSRNNCGACQCIDTKGSLSLNIYHYLKDIPFPGYQISPWRWCSLWFLILMGLPLISFIAFFLLVKFDLICGVLFPCSSLCPSQKYSLISTKLLPCNSWISWCFGHLWASRQVMCCVTMGSVTVRLSPIDPALSTSGLCFKVNKKA